MGVTKSIWPPNKKCEMFYIAMSLFLRQSKQIGWFNPNKAENLSLPYVRLTYCHIAFSRKRSEPKFNGG